MPLVVDKITQRKFMESQQSLIPMATRATETDLINLIDYISELGISTKLRQIDIREALVKAYHSPQEATKGMCKDKQEK